MDSSGFHELVKNYTNLTSEESKLAASLSGRYPYSQILYFLRARAAKDLAQADQEALLHQSAVYATDRSVLKQIMTAPRRERQVERREIVTERVVTEQAPPAEVVVKQAPVTRKDGPATVQAPVVATEKVTLTGDALRNDIYQELEKLQRLKHDFQVSVEEYEKGVPPLPPDQMVDATTEPIILEIKSTRKKIKTDNPKQKEQNEIIDQFIKATPVIPKAHPTEPATDLSEESVSLGDGVVSETLVTLLIKQGKKEKAIEVLKKLIWKFPQKKAYFAAQIESLKE